MCVTQMWSVTAPEALKIDVHVELSIHHARLEYILQEDAKQVLYGVLLTGGGWGSGFTLYDFNCPDWRRAIVVNMVHHGSKTVVVDLKMW